MKEKRWGQGLKFLASNCTTLAIIYQNISLKIIQKIISFLYACAPSQSSFKLAFFLFVTPLPIFNFGSQTQVAQSNKCANSNLETILSSSRLFLAKTFLQIVTQKFSPQKIFEETNNQINQKNCVIPIF